MTPVALVERLAAVLAPHGGRAAASYGVVVGDVPREAWAAAVAAVRDDEALDGRFFDLLTAVDQLEAGFELVVRLWSPARRHGVLLRCRCPRDDARVPSLTGLFAGAAWSEREVAEMFGVGFEGHPALTPLLLPDGFEGAPLRKDFVLAARVAKRWPGAKEPGESDRDLVEGDLVEGDTTGDAAAAPGRRPRRRQAPPGVPAPGTWPAAGQP